MFVAITSAQRDDVVGGAAPCPSCEQRCGPSFEPVEPGADVRVLSLHEGAWRRSFVLREPDH